MTENEYKILSIIAKKPSISQSGIAKELDFTVSSVKYYLSKMRKKDIVRRDGTTQKGCWKVLISL